MTALRLFYRAETGGLAPSGPAVCWFCGGSCPAEGPRPAEVIRDTFSDIDRAAAGGDGPVCAACVWYMGWKLLRPGQKRGMGAYTKTLVIWDDPPAWSEWEREAMLSDLLRWEAEGLPRPGYLTCNFSKQKHVLPWARLSPAGERWPWVATDAGAVRLTPDWPGLAWCVAWLWTRGHPKTLIAAGDVGAWALSGSDDPAADLAAAGALRRAAGPMLELISYIVTEANCDGVRDSLAGRAAPLLRGVVPRAAARRAVGHAAQRGGVTAVQEPVPEALVGDAGGAHEALRDDVRDGRALEQLPLL